MANITDESGSNILDEAGAIIADEAGPVGGASPSVGLQSLSLAVNSISISTGSAGWGIVNAVSLTLAVNNGGGFAPTVPVSTLSLTMTLKSLSTAPAETSGWLKGQFQDWIIDFAA